MRCRVIPTAFGVGPQLSLRWRRWPIRAPGLLSGLVGAAVDAVGDALGLGGGDSGSGNEQSAPAAAPRILFIWGPSRVVPVKIKSMVITEAEIDGLLNPVQAEVRIGLAIPDSAPPGD